MVAAPLIGISTSLAPATERQPERATLNAPYLRAVQAAGGVPILLSPYHGQIAIERFLPMLGGLLLTGGGDVDPTRYGEQPAGTVMEGVHPVRDSFEADLLERAMARQKPLLLICRGMQIANVALGGSLIQDIPASISESLNHSQNDRRDSTSHDVTLVSGSKAAEVLGAEHLAVNSMHHQSIRMPGSGIEITGCAPDGVVEAIEVPGYDNFAVGVQWHPEHLAAWQPAAARLFERFVQACATAAA